MSQKLLVTPAMRARIVPFAVFLVLTACQDLFKSDLKYWCYLVKTLAGLACLLSIRDQLPELRWKISLRALGAGILVFVLWVGLEPYYPNFSGVHPLWHPSGTFGWFFVAVRLLGSSLVVPMLEELFYRSFLYRFIIKADFESVPLSRFDARALVITALVFGFAHYEWLPGILCGLIYQAVVIRSGNLGEAITAHALTNFLLGLWVVWKGAWNFW